MRDEYDFTGAKKNPYAAKLKEETSVVLDEEVAAYFHQQAEKTGIPFQRLINFYLNECVKNKKTLSWN